MNVRKSVEGAKSRSRRGWVQRVAPLFSVLMLGSAALGCGSKDEKKPAPVEAPKPVPEPAGLVAELFIPKPATTFTRLRNLVGGPAMMLPPAFGQAAGMMLGLPAAVGDQLDAEIPALGAVVVEAERTYSVIGLHIKDGVRFINSATVGPDATLVAKADAASGVTILEGKPGGPTRPVRLAVSSNYLLLSPDAEGLTKLGPYIARTMPTKNVPTDEATILARHEALAGPVKGKIAGWWASTKADLEASDRAMREQHGGAAPTFGDPAGAVAKADATFQALFTIIADLSEARVTLNLDDTGTHIRATLKPSGPNGPAAQEFAAMVTGDPKPLLDMPADTLAAMMVRDSKDIRARSVADQMDSFDKVLAGKMSADDKKKLQEVLDGWSKGRGDWLFLGGALAPNANALYARSAVADTAALDRGIRGLFELPKVPAFAEPIQHWLGEMKIAVPPKADKPDSVLVAKVDRKPQPLKIEGKEIRRDAEKFEVGWSVTGDSASYVISSDAKKSLTAMTEGTKTASFGSEPEVKRAVEALGNDTSTVVVVLPLRLLTSMLVSPNPKKRPATPPTAPVVLAIGRSDTGAYLRIDGATDAVRELIRMQMQMRQ
ncbi:MAG: hypothetical protein U0165_17180 [Polyangiaceae bacterium]